MMTITAKFPKPWRLEQSDPGRNFWVYDANNQKLFHISEDDYEEDGSQRTVLGSADDDDLLLELEETLGRL